MKPVHFLTVWSIILLRVSFVKHDMGRAAVAGPKSELPLKIHGPALSAECMWITNLLKLEIGLLQCNKSARLTFQGGCKHKEGPMSATWKTKWGVRRVRRDTPTIEEALIAAESLANDPGQRAEIAASLMGLPVDEVKVLAAKQAARTRGRASLVAGRTRAVVVEYKRPRIGPGPISFARKR
jgi:hypothetical protein